MTTASSTAGPATASRTKRSAFASPMATRSRSAIGAVLCEMPRQRTSLMGADPLPVAFFGQLHQLAEVALEVLEAHGHDRHVDEDQREEDQVRGRDVLAGLVERERGHQTCGPALRPTTTSSPPSRRLSARSLPRASLCAISKRHRVMNSRIMPSSAT